MTKISHKINNLDKQLMFGSTIPGTIDVLISRGPMHTVSTTELQRSRDLRSLSHDSAQPRTSAHIAFQRRLI